MLTVSVHAIFDLSPVPSVFTVRPQASNLVGFVDCLLLSLGCVPLRSCPRRLSALDCLFPLPIIGVEKLLSSCRDCWVSTVTSAC